MRWLCQLFKAALCSTDSTHMPETSGRIHAWITRVLISHAGPRPWIGRWPPPARALAGRKVGNDMRESAKHILHPIRYLALVAILFANMQMHSATAWARTAVQISRGDPDDPEAPVPGPAKTGSALAAPARTMAANSSYTTTYLLIPTRYGFGLLMIQILRSRI